MDPIAVAADDLADEVLSQAPIALGEAWIDDLPLEPHDLGLTSRVKARRRLEGGDEALRPRGGESLALDVEGRPSLFRVEKADGPGEGAPVVVLG